MDAVRRAAFAPGSREALESRRRPRVTRGTRLGSAADETLQPSRMASPDLEAAAARDPRSERRSSNTRERMRPGLEVTARAPRERPRPPGVSDISGAPEPHARRLSVPAIRSAALVELAPPGDSDMPPGRPADGAPTIRVTIGRVEVCAVSPPSRPAPKPVELRRPLLSLDEYLERRNAGRL